MDKMTPRYRGVNSFYDGWLANVYAQSFDDSKDLAWKEGWKMGSETSLEGKIAALSAEVRLGRNVLPVEDATAP